MMITSINGLIKGYWYQDGYIRTSSKEFNLKNLENKAIHLTNDAIQKKYDDYGKYESGNKISYSEFQRYLDNNYKDQKYSFYNQIYPKMKIFGLDFMIDDNFNAFLIEINTNPCLELSCPLLARIIPQMIDNAFKITIDPLFPPLQINSNKTYNGIPQNLIELNKFELIYDEINDRAPLELLFSVTDNKNEENIEIEEEENENNSDKENYIDIL